MAAIGEDTTWVYRDGEGKIVSIDSDEHKAAKADGWKNKPQPKAEPKAEAKKTLTIPKKTVEKTD